MKRALAGLWILCVLAFLSTVAISREKPLKLVAGRPDPTGIDYAQVDPDDPEGLLGAAAVDTYTIVRYSFEAVNWQGWSRRDLTAQRDTFWHVEDYLEPALAGLPGPLEGLKSAWCGVPPGPADYFCGWPNARGYGNGWNQLLATDPFPCAGLLTFSYKGYFDSEPDYDHCYVEYYDANQGGWQTLASYTGVVDTIVSHQFVVSQAKTKLRFHFVSDGAWSDEDGLYDSDGAAHVDSVTIADVTGVLDYEDFESAPDNAMRCGLWRGDLEESYGMYSGLRVNLVDKDYCGENLSSQIVFFTGSLVASPTYPGLFVTPFCKGANQHENPCQNEIVFSPPINLTRYSTAKNNVQDAAIPPAELPDLGGIAIGWTEYEDNPLPNLVFSTWAVRSQWPSGCWGPAIEPGYFWPSVGEQRYFFRRQELGGDPWVNDTIQIALGVRDMCDVWYLIQGDCAEHTPAPWFDNVWVKRYGKTGPQWSYRDFDLFQDNFPSTDDIESYVRADAANNINPGDDPVIRPGDSITVDCSSPFGGGIAVDGGWPAVYMHVRCRYIGGEPAKPNLSGPALAGDYCRYKSDDGTWTIIQGDTARTPAGIYTGKYMFDLNDALFTRGYIIEYYFSALDAAGKTSTLPSYAQSKHQFFEWTCLPTLMSNILYVDDWDGRGSFDGLAQVYWDPTFGAVLPPTNFPDRYDVEGPSSCVGNSLASRARLAHLAQTYVGIVWDSGDLESCTICEGTVNSEKSNDCALLVDWMRTSEHSCGLFVCGDDVAYDLNNSASASARALLDTLCGVHLANTSYFELTGGRTGGGVVFPKITGAPGGVFDHVGMPDELYANGGCWGMNQFDVLEPVSNGAPALMYPDYGGNTYYAGIQSSSLNGHGYTMRTMWFGFSFMYIRDGALQTPLIRNHIFDDVRAWAFQTMGNVDITSGGAPAAYDLAQNHPNPFNPSTVFSFSMKAKGRVTLAVYDVTGARVRALVDGVREAGSYTVTWDGTNDEGRSLASGVYFYKMETKEYSKTRKMVLLR